MIQTLRLIAHVDQFIKFGGGFEKHVPLTMAGFGILYASYSLIVLLEFWFVFRIDMLRGSDKVLMASSLVRKAVNVPGDAKAVLLEADRFLTRLAV